MIKIICDRCKNEIKAGEKTWNFAWRVEENKDEFPCFKGQLCEKCKADVDEFMNRCEKVAVDKERCEKVAVPHKKIREYKEKGMKYKEIAEKLNLDINQVSNSLQRHRELISSKPEIPQPQENVQEEQETLEKPEILEEPEDKQPDYVMQIVDKFLSGVKINVIAAELGLDEEEVKDVIRGI